MEAFHQIKTSLVNSDLAKAKNALDSDAFGQWIDMCDLVKELAVDAIRSKAERITLDRINSLVWAPPSKRKQYKRL